MELNKPEPVVKVKRVKKVKKVKKSGNKRVAFSDDTINPTKKIKRKKTKMKKHEQLDDTVTINIGKMVEDNSINPEPTCDEVKPPNLMEPNPEETQDTVSKKLDFSKNDKLVSYKIKDLSFPFTLDQKTVDLLLKENKKEENVSLHMLYT